MTLEFGFIHFKMLGFFQTSMHDLVLAPSNGTEQRTRKFSSLLLECLVDAVISNVSFLIETSKPINCTSRQFAWPDFFRTIVFN